MSDSTRRVLFGNSNSNFNLKCSCNFTIDKNNDKQRCQNDKQTQQEPIDLCAIHPCPPYL